MKKNTGQFTRERSLGNQHAKGNPPNKTSYKSGANHTGAKHPSWKGGVQVNKQDCTYLYNGNGKRIRQPRAIFEAVYGEIPKGFVIFHSDGDKHNDDIENLEAISRSELLRRNRAEE